MPDLPSTGTQEYLWWSQGAADEAKARDEKLNPTARELRDALEAFARGYGQSSPADLLTGLARIYCPERLRRKYRGL